MRSSVAFSSADKVTVNFIGSLLGQRAELQLAYCSASNSPATLSVFMNRNGEQNEPLRRNVVFRVNCLAKEQQQQVVWIRTESDSKTARINFRRQCHSLSIAKQ